MADCELAYGFRLRQTYGGEQAQQLFDQDAWARSHWRIDPIQSLETFQALRLWNLSLISKLMPQEHQLRSVHPERGEMVLWTLVESMAGHDLHHFDKIACEEWGSHLSRRLLVE